MSGDGAVRAAILRWREQGLIPEELAAQLLQEVEETATGRIRLSAQYFVAITAAVVLITAAGLFVARSWADIPMMVRTLILGMTGGGLMAFGVRIEHQQRLRPVSYLLQTSGLFVLLITYMHAENTWSAQTPGGFVTGLVSLATPLLATWYALHRNHVMPAVNAAIGYAFIAVFLDRIGIPADAIVWILDGILLVVLFVLIPYLRQPGPGTATAVYAFVSSMLAGFVLVALTGLGPLDARGGTVFALDFWLLITTGTLLWAIHRAPAWLRRSWYDDLLAACVLGGAILAFGTLNEIGVDDGLSGIGSGVLGAVALYYGVRNGMAGVIVTACIAIVISVWHFGLSQAGSLGAVAALGFTAALLFWVSSKLGGSTVKPNESR